MRCLKNAIQDWGKTNADHERKLKAAKEFRSTKLFWWGDDVDEDLEFLLVQELKGMGVRRDDVGLVRNSDGSNTIHFKWAYPGGPLKKRAVTYYAADLISPQAYPDGLRKELKRGYDVYYQKSAMKCIHYMQDYLPELVFGADKCVLISPTPGLEPDQAIDKRVRVFLAEEV